MSNELYFTDRQEWRGWLEKNFETEKEVWLILPHKDTGKPKILYNDSVEEALCFGWIDSIIKKHGEDGTKQRFTPRSLKSSFSQQNIERLRWLLENNLVHPDFVQRYQDVVNVEFVFAKDIIEAIKKDKKVWQNYGGFSDTYKRIRIAYIESARKRHDEFEKRLDNFIKKTAEGKQIGYGGIEKYY